MKRHLLLNGIWDFAFTEQPPADLNLDDISFDHIITVPGCFDATQAFADRRGTGVYRRLVECAGMVKLELEAIGLRGEVFWDRRRIGTPQLPYSPESYVFDAGPEGRHELVVVTDNRIDIRPSSIFHTFYDFYGYGGIYRNVKLTELEDFYLDRIQVIPENLQDGAIRLRLFPAGTPPRSCRLSVRFDDQREPQLLEFADDEPTLKVPDFRLWTPEAPHLHTIHVRLGTEEQEHHIQFGMRTITCQKGRILLNGKPLRLIGWNRHESHPEFGPATPEYLTFSDLDMIKRQGCNFIRGCHYKQSESMLDLCDRMGILVWEESLGWGNSADQLGNPVFQELQVRQTAAMVRASINHPCVVLWGFLNECDGTKPEARQLIGKLCRTIRAEDSSRPITYASNRILNDICLDLVDVLAFNTYPGWYDHQWDEETYGIDRLVPRLRELADFAGKPEYRDKPLLISEVGASAIIGDHSGLMWSEEYQAELLATVLDEIFDNPRYSGIAMWQFSNARTYTRIQGSITRPRGFNNKGALDEFRRPKMAWNRITRILARRRFNGYLND